MWSNSQENADSVTFTEENLNEKLHFLCSGNPFEAFLEFFSIDQS